MKYLSLLLLLVLLSTCGDDLDENPGDLDRRFYQQAELEMPNPPRGEYVDWEVGQKIVFRYSFKHPDRPDIADDELTEVFWIEMEPRFTAFSYTLTDQIPRDPNGLEFYYTRSCYCYSPPYEFSELEVTGERISASLWRINFNMTAEANGESYTMADQGVYTLDTF